LKSATVRADTVPPSVVAGGGVAVYATSGLAAADSGSASTAAAVARMARAPRMVST
jgi:hypothetical protein